MQNISPSDQGGRNHWLQTDYDHHFLKLATQVSLETDDPKGKINAASAVGAVIVKNEKVISRSANRIIPKIRGVVEIDDVNSPDRYVYIEHAERCAIYDALNNNIQIAGADMYCTRFPCVDCARAIAYVGIIRLVVSKGFSGDGDWVDSQRSALQLMRRAGVTIRYLSLSD